MAALLGRPREQVLGSADLDLLSPEESALLKAAEQTVASDASTQWSEHRLDRHGKRREFSVNRMILPAGAGHFVLVSAWVELTDSRHREGQLRQALVPCGCIQ